MLKYSRTFVKVSCVALFVATVLLLGSLSPSYQDCAAESAEGYDAEQESPKKTGMIIVKRAGIIVRCSGVVIDENSGLLTALATLAIAVFTVVLAHATGGLKASADQQIAEAQELRKIAGQQTAIYGQQADIASKQHAIGRLQFMAEHRPRLRIRNIAIVPHEINGVIFHGADLWGHCYIDNIGGMTAAILDSHLEIYANQMGLPMESPYESRATIGFIDGALRTGESRACPFTRRSPLATEGEADRARDGSYPLYVLGWIDYRDDSEQGLLHGVMHRLAFCRRWDASKRRFVSIGTDPDYEYET